MTVELLHNSRIEIITRWLKGEQRDKISAARGLGAGTISAIISEWKAEIGIPNADTLLFQKIGATAEFSPLVKAARGQYVDREELKVSVIRAMGIMRSRLNYMLNSRTQNKLQEAIEELESEILVS